tara:strand:+ start:3200 stop:3787 length:588 start_codon:yes stop_codon:yes gene_type:complete
MFLDNITRKITERFTTDGATASSLDTALERRAIEIDQGKYDMRVVGITLLMFGALLYVVDSTPIGNIVAFLPYFSKDEDGSLDISLTDGGPLKKLPSILAVIIIFIGLVVALHGYRDTKAQATLIVAPLFYTFSFLFLIAGTQPRNKGTRAKICFAVSLIFFGIGIGMQAGHKDDIVEVREMEQERLADELLEDN